jgi:hypothetical protein
MINAIATARSGAIPKRRAGSVTERSPLAYEDVADHEALGRGTPAQIYVREYSIIVGYPQLIGAAFIPNVRAP